MKKKEQQLAILANRQFAGQAYLEQHVQAYFQVYLEPRREAFSHVAVRYREAHAPSLWPGYQV